MSVLDTDTLTHAHAGHTSVIRRVNEKGEKNVATTIITAIEILRGRHEFLLKAADGAQLLRAQKLLDFSEGMLRDNQIITVDSQAAAEFDRLRQIRRLKTIGRRDLLIGCISLARGAIIVTRNVAHMCQIPGLKVENWID